VVAAISVQKEASFNSSGVIASLSYRRQKGVNPVVRVRELLCPQTKVINSYAHFPFGRSNNALDTALKIKPNPFDCHVAFRVIDRGDGQFNPQFIAKISEFYAIKLLYVVDCDAGWDPEPTNDSLPHKTD
jgi:hypothetical protein